MISKKISPTFAFAIVPDETDWSWIPGSPNITENTYGSQLMIGEYDSTPWYNVANAVPLKVTTSSGSGNWTFELE